MEWVEAIDLYVFSTGKEVYANRAIIGISPNGEVFHGYDGGFAYDTLTDVESIELADFMIALWEKYKSAIGKNSIDTNYC